jgi:hypothetical protein
VSVSTFWLHFAASASRFLSPSARKREGESKTVCTDPPSHRRRRACPQCPVGVLVSGEVGALTRCVGAWAVVAGGVEEWGRQNYNYKFQISNFDCCVLERRVVFTAASCGVWVGPRGSNGGCGSAGYVSAPRGEWVGVQAGGRACNNT